MSFLLSFEGPVDLIHALEADLVRRNIGHAWIRARAHMQDVEVRHVAPDGLRRTGHASAGMWPSVELEGIVTHGEPTRLHVRGTRAAEFGYVHIAGELCGGSATAVSVLVTPLGEEQGRRTAAAGAEGSLAPSAKPSGTRAGATPTEARVAPSVAAASPPPTPNSAWGAAFNEAAKHAETAPESTAPQLPRRGDSVDHFAFGRCEVVKCDGERAHLRLTKDGRIKELAMDLLKISFLGFDAAGARRYRFDRKA